MNARLIPFCLAATGFLVVLTAFNWQGEPGDPSQRVQPQAAVGQQLTTPVADQQPVWSSQLPAASEAPENAPATLVLPLPPATQPELDLTVAPVPDDEPTVEDLPVQRNPPESPAAE
jgi:hypothetical protein